MHPTTLVVRSCALVAIAVLGIGIGPRRGAAAAESHAALAARAVAMWTQPPVETSFGDYGGEDGLTRWQADHPADDVFAFGHVLHVPGRADVVDSAGPRFLVAAYRSAFPDLVLTPFAPTVVGDAVTVRWTVSGTSQGVFAGLAPTGGPHREAGAFIFRIAGGQIVETWVYAHTAEIMREAGAAPMPEPRPSPASGSTGAPEPITPPADAVGPPDPTRDDPYYTGA